MTYCASKGAVNQITRLMAIELGPHGIRTNNVNPTVVLTEMGRKAWSDPKKSKTILDRIPLGRFAGHCKIIIPSYYLYTIRIYFYIGY